ncbi:LOW QUALITY PROTEIN: hypothetical protein CFOL_v3_20418, partial [Cephalotus follicularis]
LIQWPTPLRSPTEKRDSNKYCQYHRDHGHDTEECRHLKNQIEDMIHKGHLRKYVDRDAPQGRREHREEARQQTFVVKQYTHSKRLKTGGEEEVISFSEADYKGVHLPQDDPVVVTLQVKLFTMKRILIDSGSLTDILYKHAFDQLRILTDQLRPVKTPLVGFLGEMAHPLGSIDLSVVAGTVPRQTVQMTFLVVDSPNSYNAIIGRPRLNLMEA